MKTTNDAECSPGRLTKWTILVISVITKTGRMKK